MLAKTTVFAAMISVSSTLVMATTPLRLRNDCPWGVGMTVSSYPGNGNGVVYEGGNSVQLTIDPGTSQDINLPDGWNGRICDRAPGSGCDNDCWGGIAFGEASCSMTEWKINGANNRNYYDISNIQGYSVKQTIIPDDGTCASKACDNVNCACDQAYRPGDISGTCGGTGPIDQSVANCGTSAGYTIIYC